MQSSTNSTSAPTWTSNDIDFVLLVVGVPVCCLVIAMISISLWIRDWAMLEHQRLLSETGTTEHAVIDNKTTLDLTAGSADTEAEPKRVWELDYTVEVAGPNGEQMKVKVTKQQVFFDSPAAAGLEEAKTVEVILLPSQPQLVNLEVSAMQEIKVSYIGYICLQVACHVVGLTFLCMGVSMASMHGPGVPDNFPQFVAIWFLLMFVTASVAYLFRHKMDLRVEPKSGTVTVDDDDDDDDDDDGDDSDDNDAGVKKAFLA